MLGEHPIAPVLLAKDLAAARKFYHGKLGLQIVRENENAVVFRPGTTISSWSSSSREKGRRPTTTGP